MDIHLIAVGQRMPEWVQQGFSEYAKRMSGECRMQLIEVKGRKRKSSHQLQQLIKAEGEQMLKAIPDDVHVVALDINGRQWDTGELSEMLAKWMAMGRDVALLVGGPEGLSPACRALASESWGLSRLTFPHPLVRIIVVEQLYRAWSLLRNHPYHR